jgi:hypothetical protein
VHRSKRPSAALVIACLALFAALGGTATAAKLITSKDIKNGSIKASDLSAAAKRALKGNRGARGPSGPQGAPGVPGPAGAPGAPGPTGVAEIVAAQGEGVGIATAYCPAGTRPISGGGIEEGTGYLWASGASRDGVGVGWTVAGDSGSPVTAFVYCSAGVSKFTFPNGTSAKVLTPQRIGALRAARR